MQLVIGAGRTAAVQSKVPLGHHGDHALAAQAVGQQGAAAGWPGR